MVDGFQDRTLSSEILTDNGVADKHVAVKDNSDLEWCNFGIPHICHFFYTGRIFENQILHQKKTTKGTKNTKNVSEKVKYLHFFSLNLEKFTPDRNF